ncbi:hypothetical protein TCAL_04307 [Tigriopus californicus]|uniref:BTB domain-containing protein n=2 Tax=Tigriopus californicus TaxID=6832 RepID=A0A553NDK5_TIGCA|nr:hypothetical protein TCAL_04307 [Tigriopus californicus]|eukprot:TCALIF_04307-PA protein Name:"Similar to Klhl10 Kelch-like protein 10 (Rattus norvegicus)" AED:0.03 eAED:0.03 QI:0/-1/0/1/-1/1/1/0/713
MILIQGSWWIFGLEVRIQVRSKLEMDVILEPEERSSTPGQSSPHMVEFTSLRQHGDSDGASHDAVLVSDSGRTFPVDRTLVASHSPVLKALFTFPGEPHPDGVYSLQCIPDSCVEANLTWIYQQNLPLSLRNVTLILEGAHYLDCGEVVQKCLDFIFRHLSPSNVISLAAFGQFHQIYALSHHCQRYIEYHFRRVVQHSEFLAMDCNALFELLWLENLNAPEELVWEAVVHWIYADPEYRRVFLPTLMRAIRFCQFGYLFLSEMVIPQAQWILPDDPEVRSILSKFTSLYHKEITWSGHFMVPLVEPPFPSWPRLSQDVIVTFGGWSGEVAVNLMESYDIRANRWTTLPFFDPIDGRADFGVACLGSKIYFVGGSSNQRELRSVTSFDLITQTFTNCSPMNFVRTKACVVAFKGHLYAIGGFNGSRRSQTVERYESERNCWTKMSPLRFARSGAGSTIHRGKIVIAGGFDGFTQLDTVEAFNLATQKWVSMGKMCTRRSDLSLVSLDGVLYALGGFDGRDWLATVEYYDPRHRIWHFAPSMSSPRANFSALVVDGTIMVVGGFDGQSGIREVESYNPNQREWWPNSPLNVGRYGLGASLVTGNHLDPATLVQFAYINRDRLMEEMLASGEMAQKPRYGARTDLVTTNSDSEDEGNEEGNETDEEEVEVDEEGDQIGGEEEQALEGEIEAYFSEEDEDTSEESFGDADDEQEPA